jgi:MarR family transcriptional regulator, temperature-dependent positive regulator of motility
MGTDASEGSVVHLLHQATQVADGAFTRTVRTLTPRQFVILKAVAASEGLSQIDVVLATGIDRSTVSSMTRTLVKRGYLARKRIKGDARTYAVRLTDVGRRVLDSARPLAEKVEIGLLKRFSNAERDRLLKLLAMLASDRTD